MKKLSILTFLILLLNVNVLADWELSLNDGKITQVGSLPNTQPIYSVLFRDIGGGHSQSLVMLTTDTLSLSKIIDPINKEGFNDFFAFEMRKEYCNYGVIDIFVFWDGSLKAKTVMDGHLFMLEMFSGSVYGRESDTKEYHIYFWNMETEKYDLIKKKKISSIDLELDKMIYFAKSEKFDELFSCLEEFDYGGGYGAPFFRFPKSFSNEIWKAIHKKALSMYKNGDKKGAAELVMKMLNVTDEGIDYRLKEKNENYDFAIEVITQDKSMTNVISDCAFFLEQGDIKLQRATNIFEEIIKLFPNRLVTPLNLADAYWKLGNADEAKTYYQNYISMMKAKGIDNKIPSYVNKRVAE